MDTSKMMENYLENYGSKIKINISTFTDRILIFSHGGPIVV